MHPPNVLITNFCNQNCPFCIAREEMANFSRKKEMKFSDFCFLIKKLKEHEVLTLNLLGGEPTLHSEFSKLIDYALKNIFFIRLFTNGVFGEQIRETILKYVPRIRLVFNIKTPSFLLNSQVRKLIIDNVSIFARQTRVTLVIVDPYKDIEEVIKRVSFMDKRLIQQVVIWPRLPTPIVGEKNSLTWDDFPKVGKNLCKFIEYLEKKGPPRHIFLGTGFTPCMFTKKEKEFLARRKIEIVPEGPMWSFKFDINTDLSASHSFPLASFKQLKITKKTDLEQVRNKFIALHTKYSKELVLPKCYSCQYYKNNKCPGPNISFRMNELKYLKINLKN